jgi:uncharacterized Zn-finger protein
MCDWCNKAFNQKGSLLIHLDKHMGYRPYECHLCCMRFTQKGNLKAHLQRIHNQSLDEKPRNGGHSHVPVRNDGWTARAPIVPVDSNMKVLVTVVPVKSANIATMQLISTSHSDSSSDTSEEPVSADDNAASSSASTDVTHDSLMEGTTMMDDTKMRAMRCQF